MTKSVLGIVGGSGFYHLPGIKNPHWEKVASPWGEPSDEILFAELDGLPFRFLPRHGRGHRISPTHINYRANIDALEACRASPISCRSPPAARCKDQYPPGHFVLPDQFIDRTFAREKSFFGQGCVAHVSMAHPVSPLLVAAVETAAKAETIAATTGGTYLAMEGPQFSTRAESFLYRELGLRRDRHDQHARSQARARGRDLLRDGRHGRPTTTAGTTSSRTSTSRPSSR